MTAKAHVASSPLNNLFSFICGGGGGGDSDRSLWSRGGGDFNRFGRGKGHLHYLAVPRVGIFELFSCL